MTIRAITTATELADYPLGSTFTDRQGDVWMIDRFHPRGNGETCVHMVSPETNGTHADHVLSKWGPLTPQWRPDRPAHPTVQPTLTAAREAAASAVYPRLHWVDLTEEAQEDMTDAARAILALIGGRTEQEVIDSFLTRLGEAVAQFSGDQRLTARAAAIRGEQ